MKTLPTHFDCTVVGVTFVPGYPDNLLELSKLQFFHEHAEEYPVAVLRRNPENLYDANAIEVHVPALGDAGMIGHLPAAVAAKLAPLIDAGERWQAWFTSVRIASEHEDRPGATVTIRKINA